MLQNTKVLEAAGCGSKRKMVCWGGVRPRPGPRLPPLEGGGRQPCTGLLDVLPPVRKSPVSRCSQLLSARGTFAGRVAGMAVGEGVRTCMVRMNPHILPMSVTCVLARASDVLDVCVLEHHRCASVAVVMSSAVRCVSIMRG